jgi:hypothetical protein
LPCDCEKIIRTHLSALQYQLQSVEAASFVGMPAAERRSGRERTGKRQRGEVELLNRMRRCVAAAQNNTANIRLLHELKQKTPQGPAELVALGGAGRRTERGVEHCVAAGAQVIGSQRQPSLRSLRVAAGERRRIEFRAGLAVLLGPEDLPRGDCGATSAEDQNSIRGLSRGRGNGSRRDPAAAAPVGDEAGGEPGAADGEEGLGVFSEIANKLARLLEHRSVEPIEKHGCGAGIHLGGKFFQNLTRLKGAKIDQADCQLCLPREVEAEVGFVHWRGRVMRHGWVAVDAIDLLSGGGEELAEDQKSPKMRRSHHNWNCICG